jgi:hypothetical protein
VYNVFFKRKSADDLGSGGPGQADRRYRIDFDMMVKGSIYKRRSGDVRQFGVTVNGATVLVTSGDVVDRATHEALIEAGAIRPPKPAKDQGPDSSPKNPPDKKRAV